MQNIIEGEMTTNNNTLEAQMASRSVFIEGYEKFFENLMTIIQGKELDAELGQQISNFTKTYVLENSLASVSEYDDELYRRNYIGRDTESGWEAIRMSWQKGNKSSIHSHPQYAGYTFADGEFLIELYESVNDNSARKVGEMHIENGEVESYFAIGEADSFENHIHRITCLSDTGHSIHVYSDDALQGLIYKEVI